MPYLEQHAAVEQCQQFAHGTFILRFQGATTGYGYNYVYLGPGFNTDGLPFAYRLSDVQSTSETVAFADSGRINRWSYPGPVLEENYYLDPPSNRYPTVHFRHTGTTNVVFRDGHAEARTPTDNGVPGYWPPAADALRTRDGLFDLGLNDDLYDQQ
jgi:prepilin-type processing-associated H-X9-DG protein